MFLNNSEIFILWPLNLFHAGSLSPYNVKTSSMETNMAGTQNQKIFAFMILPDGTAVKYFSTLRMKTHPVFHVGKYWRMQVGSCIPPRIRKDNKN
jgi:hypothetical protein